MSDETKQDLPATTEDSSNTALDVVTEDTAGTDIDTVADLISSLNLPTWVLRNASKVFRQLCSAAVEWPSAFFKGKASERQVITEANTKITETVADQIIQQIRVPPEYAQIVVNKYMEKIIGEQINLDKISAIAANELKNGESSNPTNLDTSEPDKEQSTDSTNQDVNRGEEKVIDDDWLNSFETEARQKSTEEMQLRFGRILAGEIQKPGSYSIRTIKILGELDQDVAVLFKNLCSLSTGHITASSGNISSLNILTLENEFLSSHALEKYGLSYNAISTLQEYGLVLDTDFSYWHFEKLPILLRHQGQNWMVSPAAGNKVENQELQLFGIHLSRAARELYNLVDQDPTPEYTEDFKKLLAGLNVTVTEVDIISMEKGAGISWVKAKPKRD